jgi:hypothetical protein
MAHRGALRWTASIHGAPSSPPLMRHVQMNTSAPITPGKPVVISGVDELNSNHRFQLEVTATELK